MVEVWRFRRQAVGICHDEECCGERAYAYLVGFLRETYGAEGPDTDVMEHAGKSGFTLNMEMNRELQPRIDSFVRDDGVYKDLRDFAIRIGQYLPGRMCNLHILDSVKGTGIRVRAVDTPKNARSGTLHLKRRKEKADLEELAALDYGRELSMAESALSPGPSLLFTGYLHLLPESPITQTFHAEKLCPGGYPEYIESYSEEKGKLAYGEVASARLLGPELFPTRRLR